MLLSLFCRTLALLLCCTAPIWAAVAVVHTGSATGGITNTLNASLSGTPTNGNIVNASAYVAGGTNSVNDSKTGFLNQYVYAGFLLWAGDYAVFGSPSATYTDVTGITVKDLGLIEISGSYESSARYCGGTATSCSFAGALSGDIIVCSIVSTTDVITITNAGAVSYIFQDATNSVAMGYATATGGTSACGGSGTVAQVSGADYTALGAGFDTKWIGG